MIPNKRNSRLVVLWLYIAIITIGGILTYFLESPDLLSELFFIDVVLTIIVFVFSFKYGNASLYDPYWSVIPFGMLFYWIFLYGSDAITLKTILAIAALSFWSWRLTFNWLRRWKGLDDEDWRYVDLKQKSGKWYLMVNFLGIHIFPTLVVFVAAMPLYFIFMFSSEINWVTWLGFVITIGATILEMTADNQLYQFRIKENNPIAVMRFGVWRYMRHPNYLGEILFWIGLALMAYTPYTTVSIFSGSILVIVTFLLISVPMLEKRLLKSKPGYDIYMKSTWALFPKIF